MQWWMSWIRPMVSHGSRCAFIVTPSLTLEILEILSQRACWMKMDIVFPPDRWTGTWIYTTSPCFLIRNPESERHMGLLPMGEYLKHEGDGHKCAQGTSNICEHYDQ